MNDNLNLFQTSETNASLLLGEDRNFSNLIIFLSPEFLAATPEIYKRLSNLPTKVINYLLINVAKYPWINHLCLGLISCDSDIDTPLYTLAITIHSIFRNSIPLVYPTLDVLDLEDAIFRLNRDFGINFSQYCSVYLRVQNFTDLFLENLTPCEMEKLIKYQLPRLLNTVRLNKLLMATKREARNRGEIQTEPIKINLASLLQTSCLRLKWIINLYEKVDSIKSKIISEKGNFPVDLSVNSWDEKGSIKFRIWDKRSFILMHAETYNKRTMYDLPNEYEFVFIQLVGKIPENSWFLNAIEAGVFQPGKMVIRNNEYITKNNIKACFTTSNNTGILSNKSVMGRCIRWAKIHAKGNEYDSKIIFDLAPFVSAALIGNFAIQAIGFTGIRISQLQQLALDEESIKIERPPVYNDQTSNFEKDEYYTWNFYVKDRDTRVRVFVYRSLMGYIKEIKEFHKKINNGMPLKEILCSQQDSKFTLHRLFPKPRKYVLQWQGHHVSASVINTCIEFMLLEHGLTSINEESIRITAKGLRHGFAGYLHRQGVPIEYIQQLLHHIYYRVSEHYAKPTHEDIVQKINPLVNQLGTALSIDKRSIASIDELTFFTDEVLKKITTFRRVCGGRCRGTYLCEVITDCPGCSEFCPDPSRRGEIVEVIISLKNEKERLENEEKKQYIEIQRLTSSIREYELVLKEIDSWIEILKMDFSTQPLLDALPPTEFGAEEAKLIYTELKRLSDGIRTLEKEKIVI